MNNKILAGMGADLPGLKTDSISGVNIGRSAVYSTRNISITVPSGTKCLIFGHHSIRNGGANARIHSVKFNGVGMTLGSSAYRSAEYSAHLGFWFINKPPIGTFTLSYSVYSGPNYSGGRVYFLKKEMISFTPNDSGSDVDGNGNPMVTSVNAYEGGLMLASWTSFNGNPSITYLNKDTTETNYGAIGSLVPSQNLINKTIYAYYLGQYYNQGLHVISYNKDNFK